MSYIGAEPTTAAFPFDQFSGTGSATAFTLSQAPAGNTSVIVYVGGAVQNPNTYTIVGTTITFSAAPAAGTNNIGVLLLGLPALVGVPNVGTVTPAMLSTGGPSWNTGGTLSVAAITDSGNLTFTGTGNRITGDFSNATVASRVLLQTSTVNGATRLNAIPNGTSQVCDVTLWNNSDTTNASNARMFISSGNMGLVSQISGSGTYLPISFDTGGSERVRIDTSGNVGIGTSSPLTALNVNGTGGELLRISVTPDGGVIQEPAIGFATGVTNTNPAAKISALEFDASDSRASLLFYTRDSNSDVAPTERMRIDSSGNVGIGTSSPATKLHVAGGSAIARIDRTADASANPELQLSAVARQFNVGVGGATFAAAALQGAYYLYDSTAAAYRMVINSGGNVGIGTDSPLGRFSTVGGDVYMGKSGQGDIFFSNATDTYVKASTSVNFQAPNGTNVGTFNSGGNFSFNSGYGSVAVAYGTRAWINFDGSATPPTNRASGNISSIGDNGLGDYTINFSTSFPNDNYVMAGTATENYGAGNGAAIVSYDVGAASLVLKTTSACRINICNNNDDTNIDSPHIEIIFTR